MTIRKEDYIEDDEDSTIEQGHEDDDEEEEEAVVIVSAEDVTPLPMPQPSAPLEEEVYGATTLLMASAEHQPETTTTTTTATATAEPSAPVVEEELEFATRTTTTEASSSHNSNDDNDDDRRAQEFAAQAREEGVAIIRDHVSSYLEQNPEASFVTWIATLHPENAEVNIDPRFLIPGNPWFTVFEEAKATMNGVTTTTSTTAESSTNNHPQHQQTQPAPPQEEAAAARQYYYGGLIPLIVGFSMILSAIMVALTLQLSSMCFYFMAVLCNQLSKACSPSSENPWWVVACCCCCCRPLPYVLSQLFRFIDGLMLLLDTLFVEILAAVAYGICAPLSFSHVVGTFYHQQTRRLPHYVRWACRKPFDGRFDPPRGFGGNNSSSASWERGEGGSADYHLLATDQDV